MALTSTFTKQRSMSTYRTDLSKLESMVLPITPNKGSDVVDDASLARPFTEIAVNILKIYQHLRSKGINV